MVGVVGAHKNSRSAAPHSRSALEGSREASKDHAQHREIYEGAGNHLKQPRGQHTWLRWRGRVWPDQPSHGHTAAPQTQPLRLTCSMTVMFVMAHQGLGRTSL